jgi:hypothetical protein
MTNHTLPACRRSLRPLALACALLAATTAHAVVDAADTTETDGSMADMRYGGSGNIFELIPQLSVQGLGSPSNPLSVSGRNAALQYSFSVSGTGTGLVTVDYLVRNTSALESFNQLRFMVFANPDGGADFMDTVSESWGPASAGDPARREARDFDAVDGILSRFALNSNLSETPSPFDAACTVGGCDANIGLQWNADLLAPGETFRVRLGLSDNGQALSGRFLTIQSLSDPGTALTISGLGTVAAVPEPGSLALMLAGLLGVGSLARRRGLRAGA